MGLSCSDNQTELNVFLKWCVWWIYFYFGAFLLFMLNFSDPIIIICSYLFLFSDSFPSLTLQSEQQDQMKWHDISVHGSSVKFSCFWNKKCFWKITKSDLQNYKITKPFFLLCFVFCRKRENCFLIYFTWVN